MTELSKVILPSFYDFWKVVRDGVYAGLKKTFFVAKGGRNSSKSTTISIACLLLLIQFPITILAIRKVATTLQESVYEQLKEAALLLDIEDQFIFNKNPLRITYKGRGNMIIFRGADDSQKIKSIKVSKYPISVVWIEELTEFRTEDEVSTIIDSVLRAELPGNLSYKFFFSYNPPKRKQHWVNKKYETQFIPDNTYIHHSDYRTNHFLSSQTLQEINMIKETNQHKYRWVWLGEPIGGGIIPFDNLVFRDITDEEIKSFDNIRQGLDWGYAAHPACFGRMHLDKTRNKLYIFDEIFGIQLSNKYMAEEIKKKEYHNDEIIADSAEPKSIDDLKDYSIRITGAVKGPGSVEYGEKWLNDLDELVIDHNRCPNIARQFENIDYKVDKDGNIKSALEDIENDACDMVRYACERDMERSTIRFFKTTVG